MILAHKIALQVNNKQRTYLAKAAGTARFAYNWALEEWQKQYAAGKENNTLPKPNQLSLRRQLNAIKRKKYPWMLEVTKNAPQMAIIQLGAAFKNFFSKRAQYPKKRKKGIDDKFTLTNDQFSIDDSRIRIPHIGWVRMREALRFKGKIMSATISFKAGRWYASISVDTQELPHLSKSENQGAVGVDLGVSALATLSTGDIIVGPKAHSKLLKQLKLLSRNLSRKQKNSSNRKKARARLAKLHAKISFIRKDALHQLTTCLTRNYHTICIEDLNVKGMLKNRRLSRVINDMGFYEFRRQLEYKALMRGNQVIVADKWYASSKICSCCNKRLERLTLSQREWQCSHCTSIHDRDVNAAINLKNLAVSSTATACGEEGSDYSSKTIVKPSSLKQEANTLFTHE